MDDLRTIIVVSLSSLMAYLSPVYGVLFAVTMAFILNFIAGYITGMRVNKEDFDFKKAFSCIKEAGVFFVIVAAVYTIGEHLNNPGEALISISIVTYVVLYFYAVNVFKNLKRLFPGSQWIAFCYWLISFEFVKKVPFLESFLNQRKGVQDGEN